MCFRVLGRQVGVASLSPASVDVRQPCYSNGCAVRHRHHAASLTQIAPRLSAGPAPLRDSLVRSEVVGQPIQIRVLHQRCGERDALKLNGYFEWSPHQTLHYPSRPKHSMCPSTEHDVRGWGQRAAAWVRPAHQHPRSAVAATRSEPKPVGDLPVVTGYALMSHPGRPSEGKRVCSFGGAQAPCPRCDASDDDSAPRMPEGFKTEFDKKG
jgi:hypothetical protein